MRLPAEWEPQSGVMLTWPNGATDWRPTLRAITATYLSMAWEIARREPLLIVCPHPSEFLSRLHCEFQAMGNDAGRAMRNVRLVKCPYNDTWARDHGFITLVADDGGARLLDFRFNGWGGKYEATLDNAINRRLYDQRLFRGDYVPNDDFVLEGGSIESDGKGSLFTTSRCLLSPGRNQPLTAPDIEAQLLRRLSAKRIVWIDHGDIEGDDTDGHIDTLARLAPDDTIVYAGCDDPADPQYAPLQLMEEQLRTLLTLDGKPYRLLRLPSPAPVYDASDPSSRLPATYANFLVINGAVLCPSYRQPSVDQLAADVIKRAFPDREIVTIDAVPIIVQHGSVHCCAMQFPEGVLIPREKRQ